MEIRYENGFNEALPRLFDGFFNFGVEAQAAVPADLAEDKDGYRFYVDMPGLSADSLQVTVEKDWLVVEGERKRPVRGEGVQVHLAERRHGRIRRLFTLPDDASREDIKAAYRDGVLEVTVAKRPESRPVKIKVES